MRSTFLGCKWDNKKLIDEGKAGTLSSPEDILRFVDQIRQSKYSAFSHGKQLDLYAEIESELR